LKKDKLESLNQENSTKIRTLKLLTITLAKVVANKMSNGFTRSIVIVCMESSATQKLIQSTWKLGEHYRP